MFRVYGLILPFKYRYYHINEKMQLKYKDTRKVKIGEKSYQANKKTLKATLLY